MQKLKTSKTPKHLFKSLSEIVGKENVFTKPAQLILYGYDASLERALPDFVVFPGNTNQVSQVVQLAERNQVPYLPRGAGTNLSGGTVPIHGGIVLALSRLNKILEIDRENRRARVQPGVVNLHLQEALGKVGYFYPPDPASQKVSTIGGNVGENAGGPHCLKYGLTFNHVFGLTVVLPGGRVITLGGEACDEPGFDLVGLLVGSEGTLGIVTEIIVRIVPQQESCLTLLAIYDSLDSAARSVSQIMGLGITPAALELMDRPIIQAVEASYQSGFPKEAEAVLIIEIDGLQDSLSSQGELIREICRQHGAVRVEQASSGMEREKLWAGRKGAFGAIARLRPSYMVNDGTVPRTKLPEVLMKIAEISRRHTLLIGNVAHAGDGNLHPVILFDERNESEKQRVIQAGSEILRVCAEAGGTISGEHGIGLEKKREMGFIFSQRDLLPMLRVKNCFDSTGLCNPNKIFPSDTSSSMVATENEDISGACLQAEGKIDLNLPYHKESDSSLTPTTTPGAEPSDRTLPSVSPANISTLVEVIDGAHQNKTTMEITGKAIDNERTPGKTEASNGRIILSTAKLNRVPEFDPENLYIRIQAGLTCRKLDDLLAEHKLFLPFDPPFPSEDTIGGCLARNYRGLRSAAYGTPRDWVLGLTTVLPGIGCCKSGGKTVKNVSGYDLVRLFVGSHGTLGVIAEATMRLFPQPEASRTVTLELENIGQAIELGRIFLANRLLLPSALLCRKPGAEVLTNISPHIPKLDYLHQTAHLMMILEGQKPDLERQGHEIDKTLTEFRLTQSVNSFQINDAMEAQARNIWDEWKRIIPSAIAGERDGGNLFLIKANSRPAELGNTISEIEFLNQKYGLVTTIVADLPSGTAWIAVKNRLSHFSGTSKDQMPDKSLETYWKEIADLAIPQKRYLTIWAGASAVEKKYHNESTHLPGKPLFHWVFPEKLELMKRLKTSFDPNRILNPGRFPNS